MCSVPLNHNFCPRPVARWRLEYRTAKCDGKSHRAAMEPVNWSSDFHGEQNSSEVRADAKAYDGPLVKRRAPTDNDYVRIRAGKSGEVDLSSCYQVSVPGKYEVTFRGLLPDVLTKTELRAKARSVEPTSTPVQIKVGTTRFSVRSGFRIGMPIPKKARPKSGFAACLGMRRRLVQTRRPAPFSTSVRMLQRRLMWNTVNPIGGVLRERSPILW